MAANERLFGEFRFTFKCSELRVMLETEPSEFVIASASGSTTITVSAGETVSRAAAELKLTVVTRREVTGKPAKALQELSARSGPADDGTLPQYLQDLLADVDSSAREMVNRLIRLYQWRWSGQVRTRPRVWQVTSEYSITQDAWCAMPRMGTASLLKGRPHLSRIAAQHAPGVNQLLQDDFVIPLGHELLAEAEDIWTIAPRSCLILSVSALEVGFKGMVALLVPDAEWLVSELSSPPVERLLKDYLPTLPLRGQVLDGNSDHVSEEVIKQVRKAVSIRNRLVHRGRSSIEAGWLADWLILCSDLLYLFDFYCGHSWALQQIRYGRIHRIIRGNRNPPVTPPP